MKLTRKEVDIKQHAGRNAMLNCRTQPIGKYDSGVALTVEYIFMAAKHARRGEFEKAFTCARLAHDFQA